MNTYKNISFSAKTFYGVKFAPGETKEVPGYINDDGMVRILGVKPSTSKTPIYSVPASTSTRGRKKKTIESVKEEIAETPIENTTQEETTDGN